MLRTAWVLARKDLVIFFRDRTALLLSLALPVLLATVFGSAMQGMTGGGGGVKKVTLLVEDLDGSTASAALVRELAKSDGLRVVERENARRVVREGDAPAALVVPEGYGAALARGETPRLTLLRDPSQSISQQVIAGNLAPAVLKAQFANAGSSMMGRVLDVLDFPETGIAEATTVMEGTWGEMADLVARLELEGAFGPALVADPDGEEAPSEEGGFDFAEDVPRLLGIDTEDVVGADADGLPSTGGVSHAIAAMAVMMLMFSVVGAGGSLLEEQDEGTLLRLQLTPSAGPAILTGKLVMISAMGLLQLAVLFAYGWIVFDVPVFEHAPELLITSLVLVYTVTGLGLLFAVACRTRKQMEGLSTIVILVMSAVGGAWFPREVTPDWFQTAGLFTITAWAMDAYHGILWYGKSVFATAELGGVWRQLAMLVAIGTALNWLSFRTYNRRFVGR